MPGPIFANIVLADEINRTPPKTQSALLEAMQEHRVTVQGRTYTLEEPFFVFATQNPIELEGTYPLPEAQLDRFMFEIVIDYLTEDEELEVVRSTTSIQNHAVHARGHRPRTSSRSSGSSAACRSPNAVVRYAVTLARDYAPDVADGAGLREEVGVVRRQRPRGAVAGARRQGARAHARALSRGLRGHPRARAAGAAPPHPHELPRAVGAGHDRPDHRAAAEGRPDAEGGL